MPLKSIDFVKIIVRFYGYIVSSYFNNKANEH